jgi:hypothetical protein
MPDPITSKLEPEAQVMEDVRDPEFIGLEVLSPEIMESEARLGRVIVAVIDSESAEFEMIDWVTVEPEVRLGPVTVCVLELEPAGTGGMPVPGTNEDGETEFAALEVLDRIIVESERRMVDVTEVEMAIVGES